MPKKKIEWIKMDRMRRQSIKGIAGQDNDKVAASCQRQIDRRKIQSLSMICKYFIKMSDKEEECD